MSFWKSDDKIPIEQTKISIPSTNGLEYSSGGRILIEIPAGENGLEFFQPKETYLKFDVKIQDATNCPKLQLDDVIGAQVLIKNIRISSGGARNLLLEEIQDYNVLTRIKYDYESNENLRNKRHMTEGVSGYNGQNAGECGTTKSSANNTSKNNYFHPLETAPTLSWGASNQKTCKVLLPLNTGIFNNDKIFPIGLTEGLRIEIDLEDKKNVFRQMDTMNPRRCIRNNPVFHSTDGTAASTAEWAATGPSPGARVHDSFYVMRANGNQQYEDLPFHKGQKIGFVDGTLSTGMITDDVFEINGSTTRKAPVITAISASATADGGNGLWKITLDHSYDNQSGTVVIQPNQGHTNATRFYVVDLDAELGGASPSYLISNVEMIVQQIGMPAGYTGKMRSMMKEGGVMNYDFLSFTNYKYSQLLSDRVMNMRLPIGNSRAKAVLCCPVDSTVRNVSQILSCKPTINGAAGTDTGDPYEINRAGAATTHDMQLVSNSPGLTGVWDYLTDYQFFYDGKLNPSRPVECSLISNKKSIEQQPLIELEKALLVSDIQPMSFRAFQSNAVIGRALSTGDGVYDCRGKDFNLQANYREGNVGYRPASIMSDQTFGAEQTTLSTPRLPHLWNNFVSHIRRLSFKGDQISLEV